MPHECTNCNRTFADGSKEMLSGCPDCGGNKFRYRPSGGKLDAGRNDDDGGTEVTPSSGTSDTDGPLAGTIDPDDESPAPEDPSVTDPPSRSGVTDTVTRATKNLREWVGVDDDSSGSGRPGSDDESAPGKRSGDGGPDSSSRSGADEDATAGSVDDAVDQTESGERSHPVGGMDPVDEFDDAVVEEAAVTDDAEDAAQASARTSMVEPDELPDGAAAAGAAASERSGGGGDATPVDPDVDSTADDENGADEPDLSELREELNDQFESIKIVEPGQYELNLMELYDREEYIISLMEDGRYAIEVPETWRGSRE